MSGSRWRDAIAGTIDAIRDNGRWRTVRTLDDGHPATRVTSTQQPVVSFASNDYLGLTQHPVVVAAGHDALDRFGAGSGSARLIVGGRPVHDQLEQELAEWKQREAALLFPTGFQANLGAIGALVAAPGRGRVLVCSDELNHASIIDACRAARAEVAVYPHNDLGALRALLAASPDRMALVVTDSVFSMDGDVAPVDDLAALCAGHDALLVLDEAHSVLGPTSPEGAVIVGTLSKTLGSSGGFVAADQDVVDLCRNTSRAFIFTTASTPADTATALAALGVLRSDDGDALRARLRANVDRVRPGHPSPIIPVVLGSEKRAVAATADLLAHGLLVPAIRPPTVAPGTCRLRIAISAVHDERDLDRLTAALQQFGVEVGA